MFPRERSDVEYLYVNNYESKLYKEKLRPEKSISNHYVQNSFLRVQWLTIQLFVKQSVLWVKAGKTTKSITTIFTTNHLLAEQKIRRNIHVKLYRFK